MHMFREHQDNLSQAFQTSRNHTKDSRDNVGTTCKKWTVWTFFLPSIWHAASVYIIFITNISSISVFFCSHCRHVFGIKHPKRERETCFSRQVVLKELLRSGLPSKVNVQVCLPSRHVGFVYLFPELLRRAGLCGYFFKEVWGKCAWFLDLSNIAQILGAPGASLLNLSF